MRQECRERFPLDRLQKKPLVSDPGMHHGTIGTHVPWCMSGSLTHGGGENVPGIPGAYATHNLTYLARGPCTDSIRLGSLTMNHKNGFAIAKLAVGTDAWSGPSRMLSIPTEGCRVDHSREYVGTVWCTFGQANKPISVAQHTWRATYYSRRLFQRLPTLENLAMWFLRIIVRHKNLYLGWAAVPDFNTTKGKENK